MKVPYNLPRIATWLQIGLLLVTLPNAVGCGGTEGPERYLVSGTVTLRGEPVPLGEIYFEPDAAKGNRGPGATARIKEGRFETVEGMGVSAGPHKVNIVAFDGVANTSSMDGNPLTTKAYVTEVDLPAEDSTHTFEIPETHLVKP